MATAPFTADERDTLNTLLLRAAGVGEGAKRDEALLAHLTKLAGDPDAYRKAVAGFAGGAGARTESLLEGFTGTDSHGHHWVNGKQVAKPKEAGKGRPGVKASPAKANNKQGKTADNGASNVAKKADNGKVAGKPKTGRATPKEHAAIIAKVKAKFTTAPKPTRADVKAAKDGMKKEVVSRANGGDFRYRRNLVGSSVQRAARRKALQTEFGDGTKCPCIYCGVYVGDAIGPGSLEQDKIYTTAEGGKYRMPNLVPSCSPCNNKRGDKPFAEIVKKLGK